MDKTELDVRFTYHKPQGEQPRKYLSIRAMAKGFAAEINDLCPESREKSLAITKIEEAVMWANSAIARRE